jgi:hypothetical protein
MTYKDLKSRIDKIYALDAERTQGDWQATTYPEEWGESNVVFVPRNERNLNDTYLDSPEDAAFIAQAPEMVAIIRSLEARVEEQIKQMENK